MIYILLLISGILLLAVVLLKRNLERRLTETNLRWVHPGKKKSVKYLFLKGTLEFLVPFTLTALVFSALQLWVDVRLQSVEATTSIRELEAHVRRIRGYVVPFKLADWKQLLILIAILLVGYFLPKVKELEVLRRYKQTSRLVTRAYIVLTVLASFTFFSNQTGKAFNAHAARLSSQIEATESEYNAYRSELEMMARKAIAREAADTYRDVVEQLKKIANELSRIERGIEEAQDKVSNIPFIYIRTFPLEIEEFKRDFKGGEGRKNDRGDGPRPDDGGPSGPPDGGGGGSPDRGPDTPPPAPPSGPKWLEDRGDWNLAAGKRLASEAREVNQKLDAGEPQPLAEIVEKSVDVVHSDVIKGLILELITNAKGGLWHLVDVSLEPDVFYNCNDRIAGFVEKVLRRTTGGGERPTEAFAAQQQELLKQPGDPCQISRPRYRDRLKNIVARLSGERARLEQIERGISAEVNRKANAEYAQRLSSFRDEWEVTFNFEEVDTTNASPSLRAAVEESLARTVNPLERIKTLEGYTNSLNFIGNRDATPRSKYESLVSFENANLSAPVFRPRAERWFKGEHAGVGTVRKYCAECGVNVPSYSRPGMMCPFCRVVWTDITTTVTRRAGREAGVLPEAARVPAPVVVR
jgi:uncharacterized protein YukE